MPQEPGPNPIWLTLFSSMFMHGGLLHLAGNMLFLWVFGDNVEHRIGHLLFVVFYVVAGLIATLAQVLVDAGSYIPTLGASGAIAGVLGAYLVLFPTNRVTGLPVPGRRAGSRHRRDRDVGRAPGARGLRRAR